MYSVLILVQLLAGTFFLKAHKNKTGQFSYKFLGDNFSRTKRIFSQIEAPLLIKKEKIRPFYSNVQPLLEKNWCYETASTITMKCYEIVTEGLAKTLCQ